MRTPEERRQFVFPQWCLQEAPGSPASPLRSIHVLLTLTFSSATSIKLKEIFLFSFFPLTQNYTKLVSVILISPSFSCKHEQLDCSHRLVPLSWA